MKTFKEIFDEMKAKQNVSKKGKIIKTFSRTDFDDLIKAFLNDKGYSTKVVTKKEGVVTLKEIAPVQMFRDGFIKPILALAGVDKQEAGKIATDLEIGSVDGLYEFISEAIKVYIDAGKKFDFMPKDDFQGSISLADLGVTVKDFRVVGTDDHVKIRKEAHSKLIVQSKCPAHKKSKVK